MGLREFLKLGPRRETNLDDAAQKFRKSFQKNLAQINASLQYTAAFGRASWQADQVGKRDKLIDVYQATLTKFRSGDAAAANAAAEKVLDVANALAEDINNGKENTRKSADEWQESQSTFEAALALTDQLEDEGNDKSVTMRAILSKIQKQADQKDHKSAVNATKQLASNIGIPVKQGKSNHRQLKKRRNSPKSATAKKKPRLGLQTLFLSDFSTDSVNKLGDLLCHPGAPTITLSVNPYFGSSETPYQNIETVISRVHAAGKQIRLTVFLGFQDVDVKQEPKKETEKESKKPNSLKDYADQLAIFLQTQIPGSVDKKGNPVTFFKAIKQLSICPSLEDKFTDDTIKEGPAASKFEKCVKIIVKALPAEILKAKKVEFRRSVASMESAESLEGDDIDIFKAGKKLATKTITHEFHHIAHDPTDNEVDAEGYEVYANDGPFVYDPETETAESLDAQNSSPANPDPKTIDEYINEVVNGDLPDSVKEVLLWRPSYNLQEDIDPSAAIHYNDDMAIHNRPDDGLGFNDKEYELAKKFLGIKDTPSATGSAKSKAHKHQEGKQRKH